MQLYTLLSTKMKNQLNNRLVRFELTGIEPRKGDRVSVVGTGEQKFVWLNSNSQGTGQIHPNPFFCHSDGSIPKMWISPKCYPITVHVHRGGQYYTYTEFMSGGVCVEDGTVDDRDTPEDSGPETIVI